MNNNLLAKKDLTAEQLAMVQSEMNNKQKSKGIAYALWWFTGVFGGHRFYAGDIGMGLGMLFTLGGLGFWALIDVFFIGKRIENKNDEIEIDIINTIKVLSNNNNISKNII